MAGASGVDVHEALDAFSSIWPGYKGANDVARIYDHIQFRDDAQSRVQVATLFYCSQQSPALVLASQPAAQERAEVLALLDAVYCLSERALRDVRLHSHNAGRIWRRSCWRSAESSSVMSWVSCGCMQTYRNPTGNGWPSSALACLVVKIKSIFKTCNTIISRNMENMTSTLLQVI